MEDGGDRLALDAMARHRHQSVGERRAGVARGDRHRHQRGVVDPWVERPTVGVDPGVQ